LYVSRRKEIIKGRADLKQEINIENKQKQKPVLKKFL
jgi:hypothetical protein